MRERCVRLRREDGFTLIELMVVVLIIGVLTSIALPTYLGARERSQDNAAKQDLRNSVTVAKTIYSTSGSYAGLTFANMQAAEPAIDYRGPATVSSSANGFAVSVRVYLVALISYDEVNLARMSQSGRCYYARVIEEQSRTVPADAPGVYYGWRTGMAATCSGNTIAGYGTTAASFPGW